MSNRTDYVTDWIVRLSDAVNLPPLCLELFLRDGRSYYVRSVVTHDQRTDSAVIRIWDMRSLGQDDISELMSRLNQSKRDLVSVETPSDIHPKLDQGNLRLHMTDIAYCIEWHDRFWPEEAKKRFGFGPSENLIGDESATSKKP